MKLLITGLLFLSACGVANVSPAPPSFTTAEVVPPLPTDPADPMAAVIWTLNYDMRRFDEVWTWLHDTVPPGPQRARAIGAAALTGIGELDRFELHQEGIDAFAEAIIAFPEDARLPLWRSTLIFFAARNRNDTNAAMASLVDVRAASRDYPQFALFGITLAISGWADASPALIQEARTAFDDVVTTTAELQSAGDRVAVVRSRRIFDSPIAPYNISTMQTMIAELALRAGDVDSAPRSYYTALNANNAYRWPWRSEVERRSKNVEAVRAGLAARPATEYMIASRTVGSLGVPALVRDARFSGRIGNGSCTVCHTHMSTYEIKEPAAEVGWVRGKWLPIAGVPNAQPVGLLLPAGKDVRPAGFAIGPSIDQAAPRGFDTDDTLFDGTFLIAAPPGRYFVALQSTVDGQAFQGYSAGAFGTQRFLDIEAGMITDISNSPITINEKR